jgi:hypothetical protein
MFNILSDLTMVLRREFNVAVTGAGQILSSGVLGSWVTLDGSGNATLTSAATALAYPVWNESYRDGTVGAFTPDVVNSKRVTVIIGKIFATTDQFSNTTPISRGDALMTASGGILVKNTAIGTYPTVAICVKPTYTTTYFGKTLNVIDIQIV